MGRPRRPSRRAHGAPGHVRHVRGQRARRVLRVRRAQAAEDVDHGGGRVDQVAVVVVVVVVHAVAKVRGSVLCAGSSHDSSVRRVVDEQRLGPGLRRLQPRLERLLRRQRGLYRIVFGTACESGERERGEPCRALSTRVYARRARVRRRNRRVRFRHTRLVFDGLEERLAADERAVWLSGCGPGNVCQRLVERPFRPDDAAEVSLEGLPLGVGENRLPGQRINMMGQRQPEQLARPGRAPVERVRRRVAARRPSDVGGDGVFPRVRVEERRRLLRCWVWQYSDAENAREIIRRLDHAARDEQLDAG
mmetsp:Transcript_6431/g.22910  ORF Transcript_6431/g.22910 Transcript_6431/m.22910 type:complete len:306 (+) Transcript_6431:823-1740(+)